ncbi:Exodeoxyribonuclease 7 large subunit [Gemmatirosa kalamazoonensis]|uniref:Exodeoxyribonuclease 7 large subunit n=1 Tax=Gemmatirosa kalamazoonensis TaxID=861299 RepID=W0RJM0_9BACT|nr:exodeoxyribonuclease VII large subunit [Gemmatirosa kalamazoonensis]AHG90976.1 Exodeoxyribonuclease 7 large subunit [Gemmatirosa kalamazoonensis]
MSPRKPAPAPDTLDLFAVDPVLEPPRRAGSTSRRATAARQIEPTTPVEAMAPVDPYARVDADPYDGVIPGASPASAVAVSTLTLTAKEVLEGAFMPLWVRGEVSDFKAHRNGHWYFCLRDETAQIRCVIWGRDARRLPAPPDDGMQVVALGQPSVYAARGDLQFVVRTLDAQGDGLWRKALDRTRARLEADGLLDPARKRALPRLPRRVAVITSPDGAALHDIVAVVRRRCPSVEVVLVPAKVQGEGAAEELCDAVERVARWGGADVVIIGRGGGAREDLWAFNDEDLARAIAACPVPVISAVGHEVDVTICDLVADVRAATPSVAAETAVPVRSHLAAEFVALRDALSAAAQRAASDARERLQRVRAELVQVSERATERRRARIETAAGRLHALSPLATLARGYAVARASDGRTLSRVSDLSAAGEFELRVSDGAVRATTLPRDS